MLIFSGFKLSIFRFFIVLLLITFLLFFCFYVMLEVQCWFSVQLLYVPRSHYRPTTMYFVNNVTTADTQLYSSNKFNKSDWINVKHNTIYAQVTSVKLPQNLNLKETVFWHSQIIWLPNYLCRCYHQRRIIKLQMWMRSNNINSFKFIKHR